MSKLDDFAKHAKDVKSPAELYKAIDRLGPLPRYYERGGFLGTIFETPSGVIELTEPAEREARELYDYVRQIAIKLRELDRNLNRLPKYETNPFAGIQTIQEWCLDTNTQKSKPEGDGTELSNETKPKSQTKPLIIYEVHKRANRSYQWVCEQRPDLIPESPARFTRAMYDYMKENCPEYSEGSPPRYGTWTRYLRQYDQVLRELKAKKVPYLASEQPLSGIEPNEIQDISEITNRFQKD